MISDITVCNGLRRHYDNFFENFYNETTFSRNFGVVGFTFIFRSTPLCRSTPKYFEYVKLSFSTLTKYSNRNGFFPRKIMNTINNYIYIFVYFCITLLVTRKQRKLSKTTYVNNFRIDLNYASENYW